jgi:hypothetical protein
VFSSRGRRWEREEAGKIYMGKSKLTGRWDILILYMLAIGMIPCSLGFQLSFAFTDRNCSNFGPYAELCYVMLRELSHKRECE